MSILDDRDEKKFFYHATFRANLPSIKKLGLGAKQPKNWEFSNTGDLCMAQNPYAAFSYCEIADIVPPYKYKSGAVVFAIPKQILNKKLIATDKNILYDTPEDKSYVYRGIIPADQLYIVWYIKGICYIDKWSDLKRIPSFEKLI